MARGLREVALVVMVISAPARAADPDPWFSADKGLHLAAGTGLAVAGYAGASFFTSDRRVRLAVGAGLAIAAGVGKELWDLSGHGSASWKDLAWDAVGCTIGLAVAWLVDRFVLTPLLERQPLSLAVSPGACGGGRPERRPGSGWLEQGHCPC